MKLQFHWFSSSLALFLAAMVGCEPAPVTPNPVGAGEPPPDKAIGHSCLVNTECLSGYCIDGFCCNEICTGTCNVCNSSGLEGTCSEFAPGACSACAGTLGYAEQPLFTVEGRGLAVGDFNGDDILDLAAEFPVDNHASRIRVSFGYGDGMFSPPTPLDVPLYSFQARFGRVLMANLNGDDRPDLVGADTLFLNQGRGVFWNSPQLEGLTEIVIAEDLNGDGLSDLVSMNSAYDQELEEIVRPVVVAMNQGLDEWGLPVFSAPSEYFTNTEQADAVAGDVNGDGYLDLVVPDKKNPVISILLNQGDGKFLLQTEVEAPVPGAEVIVSDLNNDGRPDLIANSGYEKRLTVTLNQGLGTWGQPVDYPLSMVDVHSVVAADFNGDGWNDLAMGNRSDEGISVLLNQGNGTFALEVTYTTMASPYLLKTADVNRDGKMDLVIGHNWNVEVLYNQGAGTFANKNEIVGGTNYPDVVATDLNGDGQPDLVLTHIGFKTKAVEILINQGNGIFTPAGAYPTDGYFYTSVADLNGDAFPDIVMSSSVTTLNSHILLNQGDGTFLGGGTLALDIKTSGLATGDIDADGLVDVLAMNWEPSTLSIFRNQGNAMFAPPIVIGVGDNPRTIKLGDLNNDGLLDVTVANLSSLKVNLLMNLGGGMFAPSIDYPYETAPWGIELADLDGNQTLDLLVVDYDGGTLTVSLNNGDGTFTPRIEYAVDSGEHNHQALKAADVNQDGAMDVVFAGGLADTIEVFLNQGDGTGKLREKLLYGAGVSPAAVAIADFDGNGTPDFAVGHDSIPNFYDAEARPKSGVYLMLNQCLP